MYLMYLDESGNSKIDKPRKFPQSDFFILAGIFIKEEKYDECKESFESYKDENFPECCKDMPIHAVYLNQVDHSNKNPYNGLITQEEGKSLLRDSYRFISTLPIEAIAVMIDNVEHRNKYYNPINPYELCYTFILERFQRIIACRNEPHNRWGTINIERCSQKLAKNLTKLHDKLITRGGTFDKFDNIYRGINIEKGTRSPFYEIADMVCYAFQREYYFYLCNKMNVPHAEEEGYLEMIKDICTTKIGSHIWSETGIRLKIFPKPRTFKK